MSSHVLFLESYIESTNSLPAELQRILSNIKALDERCIDLSFQIQQGVGQLLQMPPAHAQAGGPSPEYVELSARVDVDQKMLLQFAEEKVQLAQTAHDLMEVHALELERVMDDLDKELKKSNPDAQLDWEAAAAEQFGMGMETTRGKTPRPASMVDDWGSALPDPAPPPPPVVAAVPPPPKRVASQAPAAQKSHKRPRDDAVHDAAPAPTPSAAAGPAQQAVKKKTSAMFTTPLASAPSYDDLGSLGGGYGAEEGAPSDMQTVPFMKPPPAGFKSSAPRPQAPGGRYLVATDISQALVGRHAELFWPDDNLWYLIEIQQVNMEDKSARVLYSTGDFETLDMEETARDCHMMLLDEQE